MNRKRWILLLVVLALVSACISTPQAVSNTGPFTISGFIEADEIAIAPETGGRVTAFLADVGDEVEAGAPLARLDDRIAQAQVSMAEAKVAEALARLELARHAVSDAALRSAEAQLAQAQAGRIGACQAWDDTRAILENP